MKRAMTMGAAGSASRRLSYGGLITIGLLTCAAFITFTYLSLVAVSSPTLLHGLSPSPVRTLVGLLHATSSTHSDARPSAREEDDVDEGNRLQYESRIKQVFEKASMPNRTVILTTLNEAWAKEGTMINLFLESFWNGYGTQRLLQHLVFICVDEKAYERCLLIHPHCLKIRTHDVTLSQEQTLLSANYIKLVWRRIKFLKTTLEMNFNFIFTYEAIGSEPTKFEKNFRKKQSIAGVLKIINRSGGETAYRDSLTQAKFDEQWMGARVSMWLADFVMGSSLVLH